MFFKRVNKSQLRHIVAITILVVLLGAEGYFIGYKFGQETKVQSHKQINTTIKRVSSIPSPGTVSLSSKSSFLVTSSVTYSEGLTFTAYDMPPNGNTSPISITSDRDGDIWFMGSTADDSAKIGKITSSSKITEFNIPNTDFGANDEIINGSDGNMWFIDSNLGFDKIDKITSNGKLAEFNSSYGFSNITSGPGGNVWFDDGQADIGEITPSGSITMFPNVTNGSISDITAGPDGNIWISAEPSPETYYSGGPPLPEIDKITPSGKVTAYKFPKGAGPAFLITGPDGNIWFMDALSTQLYRIGEITPSGSIKEFGSIPGAPTNIINGPDGNVWVLEQGFQTLARITPDGNITEFDIPHNIANNLTSLGSISSGSNGTLWFAEEGYNMADNGDIGIDAIVRVNLSGQ